MILLVTLNMKLYVISEKCYTFYMPFMLFWDVNLCYLCYLYILHDLMHT